MKSAAFGKKNGDARRTGGFGSGSSSSDPKNGTRSELVTKKPDIPEPDLEAQVNVQADPDSLDPSERLLAFLEPRLLELVPTIDARDKDQTEISELLRKVIIEQGSRREIEVSESEVEDLVTYLLNVYLERAGNRIGDAAKPVKIEAEDNSSETVINAKESVQPLLMEHIDAGAAAELPRPILAEQVSEIVGELLVQERISLNLREQRDLVTILLNDMLGLGPLEPLLADDDITDIMVNGPKQIYVERYGKLELTDVEFRDDQHLMNIALRIVTAIGRRVDETSPICDARLMDGSRVNVIIPPLALDGASISIRKFAKQKITLDKMIEQNNISPNMGRVLKIAAACRLNILISGGTGSGKTTMLNALSRMIDTGERVVTIEDAAELQLQQPHVVRLETRPANLEGTGEVAIRDLVKNSLRMRPDRIIVGEIRGGEAIDMLQAMNTGHDGSLGTIHANRPREALTRLENMVGMSGMKLPPKAIRTQISDALDMIIQVSRMRDGQRRVQYVTEVVGMEGDVITTQDLYRFKFTGEDERGMLKGDFVSSGIRPHFMEKAEYFGLGHALMAAM